MQLQSKFDFKSLRKAQNKIMQKYNRAGKALGKITLSEEETKQIEGILQPKFEAELEKLMKEGAPAAEPEAVPATGAAAEGGGFV